MNGISWSRKSQKQLSKLPTQDSKHIVREAQVLTQFPECRNIKRLTNHEYNYRLRVGRYRVFFEFDGDVKIISIEEVKKRDESTY